MKRSEFLTINADAAIIDMIDAWVSGKPGFTVEAYWDEFVDIMQMLASDLEKIRSNTLILICRCPPCDFTFETPIPVLISPDPFEGVCCPQCGNDNPNAVRTINYREWEKLERTLK